MVVDANLKNNKRTVDLRPLFSIIIPTYNSADKLSVALDSIKKQTFKNFEVIVCDDGSNDHTERVVNNFLSSFKIRYIRNENWGGPARPRNNGIRVALAENIAFLDADDLWYFNKLEIIKDHINDADVVFHDMDIVIDKNKKLYRKVRGRHLKSPVFIDLMRNQNALFFNSSVVAKKNIIDKVGGLTEDKNLIAVEDFDLWLKISRVTEKFKYVPNILGAYWNGGGNISSASEGLINKIVFIYDKHSRFLCEEDKMQAEMTKCYLLGRTKEKIGKSNEAIELFKKSIKSHCNKFRIRSIYWIIFLYFRNGINLIRKIIKHEEYK